MHVKHLVLRGAYGLVDQLPLPFVRDPLPLKKQEITDEFAVLNDGQAQSNSTDTSAFYEAFFSQNVLHKTGGIDEPGGLVPLVAVSLFVSYFLVYFTIWKGVESSGKVVYVTALLPYALLLILLGKALTRSAASGLKYMFYPDWSKHLTFKVRSDGVNQILYSSGVAFGPLVFYGSYRNPTDKVKHSSIWLPIINSATSLFAACVLFSFLGHVSTTMGISIEEIDIEGIELTFVAYPAMLSLLPGSNIWAVLFFIMMVVVRHVWYLSF